MSHELTAYLSVFNLILTRWIMAILSKWCKPDNFEPNNSLKRRFRKLRPSFQFGWCESFRETNSPNILVLCETNLDDSISLWRVTHKDSIAHMYGLAVHIIEGLASAQDLSLEKSADCYLYFRLALLHAASCFSFLYRSPLLLCSFLFYLSRSLYTIYYFANIIFCLVDDLAKRLLLHFSWF